MLALVTSVAAIEDPLVLGGKPDTVFHIFTVNAVDSMHWFVIQIFMVIIFLLFSATETVQITKCSAF